MLETRNLLSGTATFDPLSGELSLHGTDLVDEFTLAVDNDNSIAIAHNSEPLVPIDTTTKLPCTQGGICPTSANFNLLTAEQGNGADRLEVHTEDLVGVTGTIDGGGQSDAVSIVATKNNELLTVDGVLDQSESASGDHPSYVLGLEDLDQQADVLQLVTHDVVGIELTMRGGDDTVNMSLAESIMGTRDHSYSVDLGTGDDVLDIKTVADGDDPDNPPPDPDNPDGDIWAHVWLLNVLAGEGNDTVDAALGYATVPVSVMADVSMDLGAGDDQLGLQLESSAELMDLTLDVVAGKGNDSVDGVLLYPTNPCTVTADVSVDLGEGDDQLGLQLESSVELTDLTLDVVAGKGNDIVDGVLPFPTSPCGVTADVSMDLGEGDDQLGLQLESSAELTDLTLDVMAGEGNDIVDGVLLFPTQPCGVTADVSMDLGEGDDQLDLTMQVASSPDDPDTPPPLVDLVLAISGGKGADQLAAVLELGASTGSALVSLAGDKGDDTLTLLAADLAAAEQELTLDGGKGFDACEVSENVTVIGCEA